MSGWVAGAVVVGSVIQSNAASKAAKTQASSANYAADLQNEQYQQTREDQMPWLEAGRNALAKMGTGFTGKVDMTQDPGYQFRLSEGMKALERQAAARSGLISGGALKAASRYGQDYASNEYQNAYNRALSQYNTTAALAGIGQTAANTLGQAGQNMASNVGEAYQNAANARASGYVGGANALNQGLNTYLNYSQGQNMLNALRGPTASYAGYTPATNYGVSADYSLGTPRL